MSDKTVTFYFDYKSPYTYLAKDRAYQIEQDFDVDVDWLPYTLDIPRIFNTVEDRTDHNWRRVKYLYLDVRRWANRRGMTILGPQKIFNTLPAHIGFLWAKPRGTWRRYSDIVFERFFKRELPDIEDPARVIALLEEAGTDTDGFMAYLEGEGRALHDKIRAQAEDLGVFGVPTFLYEGEIFFGHDRVNLLREALGGGADQYGLAAGEV